MCLVYCQRFLDTHKSIKHNVTFQCIANHLLISILLYVTMTIRLTIENYVKYRCVILYIFIILKTLIIYTLYIYIYNYFVVHDFY